jgi:hypothetical protein
MTRGRFMAAVARIVLIATFEPDGNYIFRPVMMNAPGECVDREAEYPFPVDDDRRF